jgi:hypothetical protein
VDFCVPGVLRWRKRLCKGRGPRRGFAMIVIGDLQLTLPSGLCRRAVPNAMNALTRLRPATARQAQRH